MVIIFNNFESIDLIITYLINKSGIFLGNSMNCLDKIKAATGGSRLMYFEKLDSFATSISASGEKELIEYLGLPSLIDQYWYFFAADSPDDQIINPDDYNFSATFVHSPSWIAIICSKLNLNPPPFLVSSLMIKRTRTISLRGEIPCQLHISGRGDLY